MKLWRTSRRDAWLAQRSIAIAVWAVISVWAPLGANPARAEGVRSSLPLDRDFRQARRVVAIGDIHGAYNGLRSILREASLIDDRDFWIGGDAILVQTGDFLDRGPGATKVAELLMDLQRQAPEHGGKVIVLLGNHEILNLISDRRDVTKYILRNLVDSHSEKRLEVSCNAYASFYRRQAQKRRQKLPKRRDLLDRCFTEQQLGLVEYLREIGPEGKIGRWMRKLPAVVEIDGVLFIHGGISPQFAGRSLEQINREVRREIESFDRTRDFLVDQGLILPSASTAEIVSTAAGVQQAIEAAGPGSGFPVPVGLQHVLKFNDWLIVRSDGPLWFRGYAKWSDEDGEAQLPGILESMGVSHIVSAHTPQKSRKITPRFGSKVFLIDTGMLTEFYKGRPSALEIQGGRFTAVYALQKTVLHEPVALSVAD